MKGIAKLLLLGLYGIACALAATAFRPVEAAPAAAPPTSRITAREFVVVDEGGKAVITLTSGRDAHGIWVSGFQPNTTAGIVANRGFDTPYLMVLDHRGRDPVGCQWAVYSSGGEPMLQYAGKGKDSIRIFNPLKPEADVGDVKLVRPN